MEQILTIKDSVSLRSLHYSECESGRDYLVKLPSGNFTVLTFYEIQSQPTLFYGHVTVDVDLNSIEIFSLPPA